MYKYSCLYDSIQNVLFLALVQNTMGLLICAYRQTNIIWRRPFQPALDLLAKMCTHFHPAQWPILINISTISMRMYNIHLKRNDYTKVKMRGDTSKQYRLFEKKIDSGRKLYKLNRTEKYNVRLTEKK